MKVKLAYGKTGLEVEFPDEGVSVIEPRYIPGIPDEQAGIREALASPIGSPALADLVKPHHKVAITFPDVTRPCPSDRMLPAILEAISAVPRENVVLISGTGMHRPNTEEEMRRIVGAAICDNYRVINHNAFDKSTLALPEPKRRRDNSHLRFIASQPCIVCGRHPSDPHHLRFAQPRALGVKVSDEFTVPLCRVHHKQLHQAGNEVAWWHKIKIDALRIAGQFWEETHPSEATSEISGQVDVATKIE